MNLTTAGDGFESEHYEVAGSSPRQVVVRVAKEFGGEKVFAETSVSQGEFYEDQGRLIEWLKEYWNKKCRPSNPLPSTASTTRSSENSKPSTEA